MANNKELTAAEFEAIRPHLGLDEKNINAIRRVMVERVKQKDIVTELRVTKETVSAMVNRAWKAHLKHGLRPDGWVRVETVLPPEYAEVVQGMENIARARVRQ